MVCWPRPQNDDVRKPRDKPTAIDHDSGMTRSKTYGTVSADTQKQMSGLEFVQGLVDGTLPLNTMARTLAYDVTEAVAGRVVVTDRHASLFRGQRAWGACRHVGRQLHWTWHS